MASTRVRVIDRALTGRAVGQEFECPANVANALVLMRRAEYLTTAMVASRLPAILVAVVDPAKDVAQQMDTGNAQDAPALDAAPYGYKSDGTPRKRPGRAPASGEE
jgi:hypothetical protein